MTEESTEPSSLSTRQEVDKVLRKLIVEVLMVDVAPDSLEADKPDFILALGATSIDTLELIITVEERCGFEFEDDELKPELVETLDTFVGAVCRKLGIES